MFIAAASALPVCAEQFSHQMPHAAEHVSSGQLPVRSTAKPESDKHQRHDAEPPDKCESEPMDGISQPRKQHHHQ
jgi:hypothetical protein